MSSIFVSAIGLVSAAVWLVLLEVTDFNSCAVGAGLLAGLVFVGAKQDHARS